MIYFCIRLHEIPQVAWNSGFVEAIDCNKHSAKEYQEQIGYLDDLGKKNEEEALIALSEYDA